MRGLIAIVGRPNVGKSTLFNKLVGERRSIVDDMPGVTRDRIYGRFTHNEVAYELVDTGGFDPHPESPLVKVMKEQVELALEDAGAVIFLMDAKTGLNPADEEICRMLDKWKKPVFHVVNKVDSQGRENEAFEFFRLGVGKLYFVSAVHGRGVYELLDDIAASVPGAESVSPPDDSVPHVAVMGRPNVGKSTLINRLIGENRLLTSDMPGTTRDAVDTLWASPDGRQYVIVDTAGIRRKRKIEASVEYYSVIRALQSMERAHVVMLLLDARLGMEEQDARIANLAQDKGRGLVIVFNKWDLIFKDEKTADLFLKSHAERFPSLTHVPVLFASALTGKGLTRLLPAADLVKSEWEKRIPTGELNRFVEECVERTPPPAYRHKNVRLFYATQVESGPPTFVFHVNYPQGVTENYRRYLTRRFREQFSFSGAPLRLFFRKRGGRERSAFSGPLSVDS